MAKKPYEFEFAGNVHVPIAFVDLPGKPGECLKVKTLTGKKRGQERLFQTKMMKPEMLRAIGDALRENKPATTTDKDSKK